MRAHSSYRVNLTSADFRQVQSVKCWEISKTGVLRYRNGLKVRLLAWVEDENGQKCRSRGGRLWYMEHLLNETWGRVGKKLTGVQVWEAMKQVRAGTATIAHLARQYGVSRQALHQAIRGKCWRNLTA